MPTYEHHVLQQHKDQNGNMHIDYPITKSECVDGLYANAALTGIPTAPTAAAGTNTTQVATTEFVQAAVASVAGSGPSLDDLGYTITKDASTGIITCIYSDGTRIVTQKNDNGSITETTYVNDKVTKTVTTVKNSDGSITVTPVTS